MKNKILLYCGLPLLAFFFSLFVLNNQTYATSVTYEFDCFSGQSLGDYDCQNPLSIGFNFIEESGISEGSIIFQPVYVSGDFYLNFTFQAVVSGSLHISVDTNTLAYAYYSYFPTITYSYDSSVTNYSVSSSVYTWTLGVGNLLRVTVTDESSCPVCKECQECEDCSSCDSDPIAVSLTEIKTAILILAATLLVIYFLYCLYRLIIKGVGA